MSVLDHLHLPALVLLDDEDGVTREAYATAREPGRMMLYVTRDVGAQHIVWAGVERVQPLRRAAPRE